MPGVSFDRAAHFYDATRGYTTGTAERIRDSILAYTHANRATSFLELGIGTGRIAMPFVQDGYDYTGVDLSAAMMEQFRTKLADNPPAASRLHLYEADVMDMPFADGSFDVVLAVHVLHLVGDRARTLAEARRVLRPGGVLLIAADGPEDEEGESGPRLVRQKWFEILEDLHIQRPLSGPRWVTDDMIMAELHRLGAQAEAITLCTYARPALSPRQMAEMISARMFSSEWETPAADHAQATALLYSWLERAFEQPDEPESMQGNFVAVAARWPNA